jgi:hypothetical protein
MNKFIKEEEMRYYLLREYIKIEELKNKEWKKQNEEYGFLQKKDSIKNFIKKNRINLEEGRKKEGDKVSIGCIDEGIKKKIPLAGSGILFLTEEQVLEFIKKRGVDIITTHDNCGAALIWAREKKPDISQEDADKEAAKYIEMIAKKAGIKYRHISAQNMKRPPEFHSARMIFFNNVKDYFPSVIKGLPPAFSIERFTLFDPENAKKRLKLAIGIALGEHGFKKRFTEKEPLIIACVLNESDDDKEIMQEVDKILDEMGDNFKKRIKVDFFVVPKKE